MALRLRPTPSRALGTITTRGRMELKLQMLMPLMVALPELLPLTPWAGRIWSHTPGPEGNSGVAWTLLEVLPVGLLLVLPLVMPPVLPTALTRLPVVATCREKGLGKPKKPFGCCAHRGSRAL